MARSFFDWFLVIELDILWGRSVLVLVASPALIRGPNFRAVSWSYDGFMPITSLLISLLWGPPLPISQGGPGCKRDLRRSHCLLLVVVVVVVS